MGMRENLNRDLKAKLHTFDLFESYYCADPLASKLKPMLDAGVLSPNSLEAISKDENARFRGVFEEIHNAEPYYETIVLESSALPDHPSEGASSSFTLSHIRKMGAFFIDGCKSWYATKFFLCESFKYATPRDILYVSRPWPVYLLLDKICHNRFERLFSFFW
jgi:hypothetical protein